MTMNGRCALAWHGRAADEALVQLIADAINLANGRARGDGGCLALSGVKHLARRPPQNRPCACGPVVPPVGSPCSPGCRIWHMRSPTCTPRAHPHSLTHRRSPIVPQCTAHTMYRRPSWRCTVVTSRSPFSSTCSASWRRPRWVWGGGCVGVMYNTWQYTPVHRCLHDSPGGVGVRARARDAAHAAAWWSPVGDVSAAAGQGCGGG